MSWPDDTAVPLPWDFAPTDPNSTAVGGTNVDYAGNYAAYEAAHPDRSLWEWVGFAVAEGTKATGTGKAYDLADRYLFGGFLPAGRTPGVLDPAGALGDLGRDAKDLLHPLTEELLDPLADLAKWLAIGAAGIGAILLLRG